MILRYNTLNGASVRTAKNNKKLRLLVRLKTASLLKED